MEYLKRYESGDFGVWDELVNLAPEVLDNPSLREETVAVANALMERVRTNVDVVRNTLINAGASLRQQAGPLSANDFAFLTERFGPLPLALDVFYRTIGSIELTPPDYYYGEVSLEAMDGVSLLALDPLEIEPASDFVWLIDQYEDRDDEDQAFDLHLCPDFLHKADISGGMPYSVELPPDTPRDAIDPFVVWERNKLSFVNYLRYCFKWGGFPRLDVCEVENDKDIELNWRMGFENVKGPWRPAYRRVLTALRKGVVEF